MVKTVEDKVLAFVKRKKGVTNKDIREHIYPDADTYMPDVDKAIQKLGKSGKIRYVSKMWVDGELKTCPKCRGTGMVKS